jgi:hypothetical protein
MPNWEAYQEAHKRGILPPEKQALYEEALRRGIAPGGHRLTPDEPGLQGPGVSLGKPPGWMKDVPPITQQFRDLPKFAAKALPAIGDVIGTFAAPQYRGALKLGPKLINLGSRMLGSGVGSGAGSIAGQAIEGEGVDLGQVGGEALLGMGGEAGFSAVSGITKPFRKFGKELLSDVTVAGSAIKNKLRRKLVERTTKRAQKFTNDIAPELVKKQDVGIDDLGFMVDAAMDESRAMYSVYETALDRFAKEKGGGVVYLDDTAQLLGDLKEEFGKAIAQRSKRAPNELTMQNAVLREMGYTPTTGFEVKKLFLSDEVTPEQVKYLLATVFKKGQKGGFYDLAPSQRALREKLKEALLSDIDKISMGTKTAKVLKKEADEVFKSIKQFKFVKGLFDKGIQIDKASGRARLLPNLIAENIYRNEKRILKDMPDLWPALKKEADYYRGVATQFEKEATQYMTGLGQVASRGFGGTAGALLFGAPGAIGAEVFGAISAYSLLSPVVQKTLSVAWKGTGKAGLHLGGKAVLFRKPEEEE